MSRIAVSHSDRELRQLDSVVEDGGFSGRADAVRAAIGMLAAAMRERRIAASHASAYAEAPLTPAEIEMLDAAVDLAAELPR